MDVALGIFLRPDPKAGDFTPFNPYLYCAANPLAYIDPTGESISFYGSIEDLQRVIKILNDANKELEFGLDTSNHNSTNIATLTYTERNPGTELSLGSQAYKQMIDDKRDVKINVESGTQVRIGDGLTGTIDIADIEQLGDIDQYLNSYGALSHELREQYYYQSPTFRQDLIDAPRERLKRAHIEHGLHFEELIYNFDPVDCQDLILRAPTNRFINVLVPKKDTTVKKESYLGIRYDIIFDERNNVMGLLMKNIIVKDSDLLKNK